ncbi:MAG: hypothetical protein Kow0032_25760 [Methyloligellaceae bacterium]
MKLTPALASGVAKVVAPAVRARAAAAVSRVFFSMGSLRYLRSALRFPVSSFCGTGRDHPAVPIMEPTLAERG